MYLRRFWMRWHLWMVQGGEYFPKRPRPDSAAISVFKQLDTQQICQVMSAISIICRLVKKDVPVAEICSILPRWERASYAFEGSKRFQAVLDDAQHFYEVPLEDMGTLTEVVDFLFFLAVSDGAYEFKRKNWRRNRTLRWYAFSSICTADRRKLKSAVEEGWNSNRFNCQAMVDDVVYEGQRRFLAWSNPYWGVLKDSSRKKQKALSW